MEVQGFIIYILLCCFLISGIALYSFLHSMVSVPDYCESPKTKLMLGVFEKSPKTCY